MFEIEKGLEALRGLTITETVVALAELYERRYGFSPEQINEGMCWDFADDLKWLLPEATKLSNYPAAESGEWHHAFILLDGRYYDSETPSGVTDWTQLPCCVRCTEGGCDGGNLG
jgi:hypothetical protein